MKVWHGFGSEHSSNLVMIGRFKEIHEAKEAKRVIDQLIKQVGAEPELYRWDTAPEGRRYSDTMLELFNKSGIYNVGPSELDQFNYDVDVDLRESEIVITTEEIDVSAFLKILIDKGARVEVYSGHDYPDTKYGRGK